LNQKWVWHKGMNGRSNNLEEQLITYARMLKLNVKRFRSLPVRRACARKDSS